MFTFILGVLLGRYLSRFRWKERLVQGFEAEIAACKSVNSLLTKLVIRGDERYTPLIQKYEALGKKASLRELKIELKTLLKSDTINKQ